VEIRFVLHRPKRSENIGAAARALANTGAGSLWVVDPQAFDEATVVKVATHGARFVVDAMKVVPTLGDALEGCVYAIGTAGRGGEHAVRGALDPGQAARALVAEVDGPAAIVFGDEQNGLGNADLRRMHAVATIPTAEKSSLNLAQAVMVFGWEIHKARGAAPLPQRRTGPLADDRLLDILRGRARGLLLDAGFLNKQEPDRVLDEIMAVLRRARVTRREAEMLLALLQQLQRTRAS
jgi:tRNA/rRNA methyltransferase